MVIAFDNNFTFFANNFVNRFMLGLAGLPSLIMFIGFLFMPESPRWLVFRGKIDRARQVLGKVRQHHEVEEELRTIVKDREDHKKSQRGKTSVYSRIFSVVDTTES